MFIQVGNETNVHFSVATQGDFFWYVMGSRTQHVFEKTKTIIVSLPHF